MIVHVKATSLIPDGGVVVRGGVGATLVDGDGVPDSLGRVVELVPEPAPEVVPAPDEPRCPVEDVEAVAAADDVAALGLGTEVDSAPEWESFGAVDPIEAAALVASVGREPPNNDATPQPASARTIAKIPTAPIRTLTAYRLRHRRRGADGDLPRAPSSSHARIGACARLWNVLTQNPALTRQQRWVPWGSNPRPPSGALGLLPAHDQVQRLAGTSRRTWRPGV